MISIMISKMISYMMARCLYQQPKTRCIESCRSRALQVQAQDVQNRRWYSALLDEARLVLGVRRIRPRRRVSQSTCTGELEISKAFAWRDNPLYAGASFLKWNTPPARIHESVGHSEWIESDITIWTQLEIPVWNSSWTYTVGIPTGVWVKMWNREHKTICNSRVPSDSKNFCWLGCARFWSTVVSPFQPFACESLFSNRIFAWKLPVHKAHSR